MTSVIRFTHWVIFRLKHLRIWVPPTQFQKFKENFLIGFPGNWTKILVPPESAWFTESFPIFWNKKIAHTKKLSRFPISEFNLCITYHSEAQIVVFLEISRSGRHRTTIMDWKIPPDRAWPVSRSNINLRQTRSFWWDFSVHIGGPMTSERKLWPILTIPPDPTWPVSRSNTNLRQTRWVWWDGLVYEGCEAHFECLDLDTNDLDRVRMDVRTCTYKTIIED